MRDLEGKSIFFKIIIINNPPPIEIKILTTPLTPLVIYYDNPNKNRNLSYISFLVYDTSSLVLENYVTCNHYHLIPCNFPLMARTPLPLDK